MKREKAIRILIKQAKKTRQKLAFENGLYNLGYIYPRSVIAHFEYEDITEAIRIMEKEIR